MQTRFAPVLLGLVALSLTSCATMDMVDKANGRPGPLDPPNQPPTNPNPAYYALIPVVLPFDIIAWPFQMIYLNNRNDGAPPPGYYQQGPPPAPYQSEPYQQPYRPVPGGS